MMTSDHNECVKLTVDDIFNTNDVDDLSDFSDEVSENERIPISYVEDEIDVNDDNLETINEDDVLEKLLNLFEKDFPESSLQTPESVGSDRTHRLEELSTGHDTPSSSELSTVALFSKVFTVKKVIRHKRITHGKIKDLKWKKNFLLVKKNDVKLFKNSL